MKDLPEALARALTPLWNQFPRQSSLDRLVVSGHPPAAAAGSVETVLEDEALAAPVLQAALWLYADDLDRSHRICQQIDDATGSFWHGIMHRREGDFDNSRYWFNKVGDHPAISLIGYDPRDFISAVEKRHAEAPADLVALQRREWETLFTWCAAEYGG
jgi:hypothetical protein